MSTVRHRLRPAQCKSNSSPAPPIQNNRGSYHRRGIDPTSNPITRSTANINTNTNKNININTIINSPLPSTSLLIGITEEGMGVGTNIHNTRNPSESVNILPPFRENIEAYEKSTNSSNSNSTSISTSTSIEYTSSVVSYMMPSISDNLNSDEYSSNSSTFLPSIFNTTEVTPQLRPMSSSVAGNYSYVGTKRLSMINVPIQGVSPDKKTTTAPNTLELSQNTSRRISQQGNNDVIQPSRTGSAFDLSLFLTPVPPNPPVARSIISKKSNEIRKRSATVKIFDNLDSNNEEIELKNQINSKVSNGKSSNSEHSLKELGESFCAGDNVAFLLVNSTSFFNNVENVNKIIIWPSIEQFFSSVFNKLYSNKNDPTNFFLQISLTLLKHDQVKELLYIPEDGGTESLFYTKGYLNASTLCGPHLRNTIYREVSSLKDLQQIIFEAIGGVTIDDLRSGIFIFSAILRKIEKKTNDIILSSLFASISTVETIHMAIKSRKPPLTASLFRAVYRSPRLLFSLVRPLFIDGEDLSLNENVLLNEVRLVLRHRAINPLNSEETSSVRSFLNSALKLYESSINNNTTTTTNNNNTNNNDNENLLEKEYANSGDYSMSSMNHEVYKRLKSFSNDIELALRAPISDFIRFPKEEKVVSKESFEVKEAVSLPPRSKKGKSAKKKNKSRESLKPKVLASRWIPKPMIINLFAGALAAPIGGIQPLFINNTENKKDSLEELNSIEDRFYSLVLLEIDETVEKREIVYLQDTNCLKVKGTEESSPILKFCADEVSVRRRKIGPKGIEIEKTPTPFLVNRAYHLFTQGYNTAILLMRDGAKNYADIFASPMWMSLRGFVATLLPSLSQGSELYISVTQLLSRDCVRDQLVTGSDDGREAAVVLPFLSAWTPAGPVIRGAQFICLKSVEDFMGILRHLRDNGNEVNTSQISGVNLIFSFILKRVQTLEAPLSNNNNNNNNKQNSDVLLSSFTFTLATRPEAYKSLWIQDHVSLEHGKNIYCCAQRHFSLCVTEVATTSPSCIAFLDVQYLLQNSHITHSHKLWSMQQLQQYLAKRCALFIQELQFRKGGNVAQLSDDERHLILSDINVATPKIILEAWILTERMKSVVIEFLDTPFNTPPMAIVSDGTYDITSPPSCFRHLLISSVSKLIKNNNSSSNNSPGAGGGSSISMNRNIYNIMKLNSLENLRSQEEHVAPVVAVVSDAPIESRKDKKTSLLQLSFNKLQVIEELPSKDNTRERFPSVQAVSALPSNTISISGVLEKEPTFISRDPLILNSERRNSKKDEDINSQCPCFLPRDNINDTQTIRSKRLDEILQRAYEVFKKPNDEKACKGGSIHSTAAVIRSNSKSIKNIKLMKGRIRVKDEEAAIEVLDKPKCDINSLSDLPGVLEMLSELVSKFLKGFNTTILTSEFLKYKSPLTVSLLLDIVRLALKQKNDETYISFSFTLICHGRIVYDLLTLPELVKPCELTFAQSLLIGPIITNGVAWHDVYHSHEVDALAERVNTTLLKLFLKSKLNSEFKNSFIMLNIIARKVEPHDVIFSSFIGFSVRDTVQVYKCLIPKQRRVSYLEYESSIIRFSLKERASFVKSLFIYHETMPEKDAQHFLQVQKELITCSITLPSVWSLASVTKYQRNLLQNSSRWRKLLRLPSSDEENKKDMLNFTRQLNYFSTILTDTHKTLPLEGTESKNSPLSDQPLKETQKDHLIKSNKEEKINYNNKITKELIKIIINVCNISSTLRTVGLLVNATSGWKMEKMHTVTITEQKKTFHVSEDVSVSGQGLQMRDDIYSDIYKMTIEEFFRGRDSLIVLGGTNSPGKTSAMITRSVVQDVLREQITKKSSEAMLWISISCVQMINDFEGFDLLVESPQEITNITLPNASHESFHLQGVSRKPLKDQEEILPIFDSISRHQSELLDKYQSEENYFICNIIIFKNENDSLPLASLCIFELSATLLKLPRDNESRNILSEKEENISNCKKWQPNAVVCVETHHSDSSHELKTLLEFQQCLTHRANNFPDCNNKVND